MTTLTIKDSVKRNALAGPDAGPSQGEPPWFEILEPGYRSLIGGFEAIIFPDRLVTRRLTRHVVVTPKGATLYAARTIQEAWEYCEAADFKSVGLVAGGRALRVSPPSIAVPPFDPNQFVLFDQHEGSE